MVHFSLHNGLVASFVALGVTSWGFAFSSFSTSIGQPGFYLYFGLDPTSSYTADILGAASGVFAAGNFIGAITQGFVSDSLGRKWAIVIASTISLIGGALTAGSVNVGMLIAMRLVHGLGTGAQMTLSPIFLTEIAPPQIRGFVSGFTAIALVFGYIVAAWVGFAAYFSPNLTLQWRLPLALCCLWPAISLAGIYWVPESPRFLVWAGKKDKAWEVLRRIHHDPKESDDISAHAEFTQIYKQIEHDKEADVGYWKLVTVPSWRKRTLLALAMGFGLQSTGVAGITNFLILIYQSLGMTGYMPLLMYCVYVCVGTILNCVGAAVLDRVGRRRMFLIGYPGCALCLLAEALLQRSYVGTDNQSGLAACVFFVFGFLVFYSICLDPAFFVFIGEVFPTNIRAKGVGIAQGTYFLGIILWGTPSPAAFKSIGWRYYLVWVAITCCSTVVTYSFIPETSKKTVEELGEVFGDKVVVHLTEDGQGIVEEMEDDEKEPAAQVGESFEVEEAGRKNIV